MLRPIDGAAKVDRLDRAKGTLGDTPRLEAGGLAADVAPHAFESPRLDRNRGAVSASPRVGAWRRVNTSSPRRARASPRCTSPAAAHVLADASTGKTGRSTAGADALGGGDDGPVEDPIEDWNLVDPYPPRWTPDGDRLTAGGNRAVLNQRVGQPLPATL